MLFNVQQHKNKTSVQINKIRILLILADHLLKSNKFKFNECLWHGFSEEVKRKKSFVQAQSKTNVSQWLAYNITGVMWYRRRARHICSRPDVAQQKCYALDWIVQCLTSPPTQYRLYGRRFLQVKRPNQQYQSTEGSYKTQNIMLFESHASTLINSVDACDWCVLMRRID